MMRRSLAATVCVAAALALAGCATAATPTTTSPGAVAPAAVTYSTAGELAKGLSAATADNQSAKLVFSFGGGGQSITGAGAYSVKGADTALKMSMSIPQQGDVDVIVLGTDVYVHVPGNSSGKPWIKASADPDDPVGSEFAGIGEQLDVSKQFAQLEQGGTLTGSAADTVDGAPTTRYTITLDTARLAANADPAQKKQADTLLNAGVRTFDMQVWVDGQNRPAKVGTRFPVGSQTATVEMKYSDWGKPVDIAAPPADQVGSLAR